MKFIKFEHRQEHRDLAVELASGFGKTKNPNHTGGSSRARGMLAEIVFAEVFGVARRDKQFRQDFIVGDHLINVKSNACKVYPSTRWEVSVFRCDLPQFDQRGIDLVFLKLSFKPPIAYIVGWLSLIEFTREARLICKGDEFLSGTCHDDTFALRIDMLNAIATLRKDGNIFAGEFCLPPR